MPLEPLWPCGLPMGSPFATSLATIRCFCPKWPGTYQGPRGTHKALKWARRQAPSTDQEDMAHRCHHGKPRKSHRGRPWKPRMAMDNSWVAPGTVAPGYPLGTPTSKVTPGNPWAPWSLLAFVGSLLAPWCIPSMGTPAATGLALRTSHQRRDVGCQGLGQWRSSGAL